MTVLTHWDNAEKTILVVEYIGAWTWDELHTARDQANREFDQMAQPLRIHIIHDWAKSTGFPPDVLSQAGKLMQVLHPRVGTHVFIGFSPLFMSLFQVFKRFYNPVSSAQFVYGHNLEEARAILNTIIRKESASSGDS